MSKRLLEDGTIRLLESGGARLLQTPALPSAFRRRLLENGSFLLLESGGFRFLEPGSTSLVPSQGRRRLLENGSFLLLESGGYRFLEPGIPSSFPSGGMRWGGTTVFSLPPLTTFRTTYTRQILAIPDGVDLRVSWVSLELPGTWFQLYVNGKLTWWGRARFTHIPYPRTSEIFVVGAVPASMAATDFSASLPVVPRHRIELTWLGGRYLGIDIAGFNVYLGTSAGLPVDYTKVVATIPAYSGHQILDGYGEGGYGAGGYGSAATHYQWISNPVSSGTWNVAVKSVDLLGNESSSAITGAVVVSGPPEPPARDAKGIRLHYTYDAATHEVTLNWLASPSF